MTLRSFVAEPWRFRLGMALMILSILAGLPAMAQAEDETPWVTLDPHPEYSSAHTVTFTGTATHENSPIGSVEYRIDDGPWLEAMAVDGAFGDSMTELYAFAAGNLDDGWHAVDVKATTKAGYTTAPEGYATAVFCVDTLAPTVSLTPLSPDPSADNTPTLVGVAEDSTSPIAAVEYRVNSGEWSAAQASDGGFDSLSEGYSFTTTALTDGAHAVQARAIDAAGNVSAPVGDSFTVDTTAPLLVLEAVPGYISTSTVVLGGTAADADSIVASVEYSTDGAPWTPATASDGAFDELTEQFTLTVADFGDGVHAVAIRAADALGNSTAVSDYLSSRFIVDSTAPGVLLVPLGSDPASDSTPSFTGSASDASSPIVLVQYRVDGGPWIAASAADGAFDEPGEDMTFTTAELGDGTHSVELMAIEAAGNVSALVGHSFTIDTTVPVISIDDIPDSVSELADITGMASDGPPGQIARVQVSIGRNSDGTCWDGSAWVDGVAWLDAIGCANWSYSLPVLTDGQSYSVRAVCLDTAGNLSVEAKESFTVVMTSPAGADQPSTPDLLDPDGEMGSRNSSPPWWWFLGSGLGISALIAFILVRKARRGNIST